MPYFFTFIYYFCIVELQQLKDRLWFIDIRQIWDTGGLIIQGYRITIIVVAFLFILTILLFFFYYYGDLRDLHSFPTRRSSDLAFDWLQFIGAENKQGNITAEECNDITRKISLKSFESAYKVLIIWMPEYLTKNGNKLLKLLRSEEHTSELQSLAYLVCRLLLEK